MSRIHLSLVALALASLPAIAMAQSEVRFVSGQQKQNGAVLEEIFGAFNAGQADVKVNLEIDNKSDLDTTQKVLADIVAGTAPDAVRITGAVLRAYVDSGRAQPLDACLASSPDLAAQLDTGLLDNFRVDGKLYAMPWYTTLPALFINADAFRAAGLDPANPPRTWSELEAAAEKLKDPASGKYGVLMYMPNTYVYEGQLVSAGGSMVGADGLSAVNSQASIEVMDFMRHLVETEAMPAIAPGGFWGEYGPLFQSGNVGMLLISASSYNSLAKDLPFELTMTPMPIKDGGELHTMASGNGFVMLATDPVRQDATCKALLSLVTPQSTALTVKATASSPHNREAAKAADLLGDFYKANPALVLINNQPSQAWYTLPGNTNNEFQASFGDIQYEILTGATAPKDGLDRLAAVMNDLTAN